MTDHVIIVGAGHAAGQAAASLRAEGYEGRLTLIGEEAYLPYQRPPLSKKFLAGEIEFDRLYFKPPEFYEQANVAVRLNCEVTAIDRSTHELSVQDLTSSHVETVPYSKVILATGGRVRTLSMPGSELDGIHYLRTIADVTAIQSHFREGAKLAIVGGGYIGLEVAAVAVKRGLEVTVIEMAPSVLARVVDPIVSRFYERVHREEGVVLKTGVGVTGFEGNGRVERLMCTDGSAVEADFVIAGIGIIPNVELAQHAGLKVDNGIVVDEYCRTDDPDILAIGDCTNHPNGLIGRRLRLESVHNALEQGKTAAATICGKLKPYEQIPWFWSDQYDLKLQIVGLSTGYDQAVVRGDPETGRSFAVFYLKEGVLIAVDAINRAPEFMMSKMLIAKKTRLDPKRIADETVPVKELAA